MGQKNRNFFYGDLSIQVVETKPGIEGDNKNVDYKIVFEVNGEKVVLHAYNGKQRFIECYVSEADDFNESVLVNLRKTDKRGNVKLKTSQPLSCNRCS